MSTATTSNGTATTSKGESKTESGGIDLTSITIPFKVSHLKAGNTLCVNDTMILLQDGVTTLEVRKSPKFEPKQIPWRHGLVRDIVWSSNLGVFILLTQKNLFTFDPTSVFATTVGKEPELKIKRFDKVKPYEEQHSFWRCTCYASTIDISYSGFGSVIDQYTLGKSSCEIVKRHLPPLTCAKHEGIWCIRYHEGTDQMAMTIMDATNNHWRIEVRKVKTLSHIWKLQLPVEHGDCEVSPLLNQQWLIINSCGIRLLQIGHGKFHAVVEYERELRNAILFGKTHFVVRTKNTIEIHRVKEASKELKNVT